MPIGAESNFQGVIDLVRMKAISFDEKDKGVTVIENPARMGETVAAWFEARRAAGPAAPAKKTAGRKRGGA